MVGEIHSVPAIALVLHPHRLAFVVLGGVGLRLRRREDFVLVAALVPLGRDEVGMNSFVREIEHERLVQFARL